MRLIVINLISHCFQLSNKVTNDFLLALLGHNKAIRSPP